MLQQELTVDPVLKGQILQLRLVRVEPLRYEIVLVI